MGQVISVPLRARAYHISDRYTLYERSGPTRSRTRSNRILLNNTRFQRRDRAVMIAIVGVGYANTSFAARHRGLTRLQNRELPELPIELLEIILVLAGFMYRRSNTPYGISPLAYPSWIASQRQPTTVFDWF